jgi:alkylated DNA repair dioxygenase AlkB
VSQLGLFDTTEGQHSAAVRRTAAWPAGLRLEDGFLAREEEAALLERFRALPLQHAEYHQYTARRRIVSYGGRYDFAKQRLQAAEPIPHWLQDLKARAARWANLDPDSVVQGLIAEYAPGTPLGWHRDVPDFEAIVGLSLGDVATMRLRRYPPQREPGKPARADLTLTLQPRSIYTLQDDARWAWQHAVSPTKALRYSVTFRSARDAR